jgi:hypothetical protein
MANHIKVKRKDTTDIATGRSASYIDIQLEIDGKGQFRTKLYGIPAISHKRLEKIESYYDFLSRY